ncbi:hypothetical protein ANAPC1_01169 [Anaplasma phagocytophilum]|uniref:Uncharacterized protein n=1 Tax=Anaplasma phagocytophilum TaxID=948 RepID=A0AA45ZHV8_ANAPH|nr:hypothetical protein ANAPC1_01169 [Anaplasma phagocytophilum]SBO30125.1 hypothetical protein ANAPC4_00103 [Anaplasma phagocytophilum]SBO32179.1 hypothetical protein ANAPC2_00937 [Anaplasma phagocytophilum]SBO32377.1 hypothetical protein ANAPC3_00843 [Anaplasma phagocytophilum]SCV64198.1 hypothetical protein ANAPC5_00799 [Anaplasma phagocytophilum]
MMLLLDSRITLLLLLLRPLVKISFSLLRPLRFLILISMGRFVGLLRDTRVNRLAMGYMQAKLTLEIIREIKGRQRCAVDMALKLAEAHRHPNRVTRRF